MVKVISSLSNLFEKGVTLCGKSVHVARDSGSPSVCGPLPPIADDGKKNLDRKPATRRTQQRNTMNGHETRRRGKRRYETRKAIEDKKRGNEGREERNKYEQTWETRQWIRNEERDKEERSETMRRKEKRI